MSRSQVDCLATHPLPAVVRMHPSVDLSNEVTVEPDIRRHAKMGRAIVRAYALKTFDTNNEMDSIVRDIITDLLHAYHQSNPSETEQGTLTLLDDARERFTEEMRGNA